MYSGFWDINGDETDAISEATYNWDFNGNGTKTDILNVDESLITWGWNADRTSAIGMSDDDFAADVNLIHSYSRMVIQLNQCFSGGFIHHLSGPNRVLMSAASKNEFGWCDVTTYGHFPRRYFAALSGSDPVTGTAVNADTNGDGVVSLEEAYLFARPFVTFEEEPQYCDDGSGNPVDVPGQGNSQGAFGAGCCLPL